MEHIPSIVTFPSLTVLAMVEVVDVPLVFSGVRSFSDAVDEIMMLLVWFETWLVLSTIMPEETVIILLDMLKRNLSR